MTFLSTADAIRMADFVGIRNADDDGRLHPAIAYPLLLTAGAVSWAIIIIAFVEIFGLAVRLAG